MIKEFTLVTRFLGKRRTVKVKIYDDRELMLRHGREWAGEEHITNADAMAQGYSRNQNPQVTVRFWTGNLPMWIIVHELVHAAQEIYRWDVDLTQGEHWLLGNEDFAWLVSNLVEQMQYALDRHGFIPGDTK